MNFRSKKEKLARAEARVTKLERKLARVTRNEDKAVKQLTRLRKHRKVRKAETLSRLLSERAGEMRMESTKRGRKAAKAARKAAKELRSSAERTADNARSALST